MPTVVCPTCAGPWWPAHPYGVITFQHAANCTIRARDDARRIADSTTRASWRLSTPTERMLLIHVGFDSGAKGVNQELRTFLVRRSPAILTYMWPDLDHSHITTE